MDHLMPEESTTKLGEQPGLNQAEQENIRRYCMEKLDSAMELSDVDKVMSYGIQYNLPDVVLKSYIKKGNLHYSEKNYADGLKNYNEALQLAYREEKDEGLAAYGLK